MSNRIYKYGKIEALDETNKNLIKSIARWLSENTYMTDVSELDFWQSIHEKFGFSFRLTYHDDFGKRTSEFGDLDKDVRLKEEEQYLAEET
jgi:hypothetical protein